MGQGANRVSTHDLTLEPKMQARAIEGEIEHLRSRLDKSLAELDRRRHELTDVQLQVRRHPRVVIGAGVLVALLVGGMAVSIYLARRRERPVERSRRMRLAMERMAAHPEKVARPEAGAAQKILVAVGTTALTMVVKKLIGRAMSARPA